MYTTPTEFTAGDCGTYASLCEMLHDNPDQQMQCAELYDIHLMLQTGSAGRCLVVCATLDRMATEHKSPDILRDLIRPLEGRHVEENLLVLTRVVLPCRLRLFVHRAFLKGNPRYA